MTVIPDRLHSEFFRLVIEHLKNQSKRFEKIIINVPFLYKKTRAAYRIPKWVLDDSKIHIHRCEDQGPATKLLGYYEKLQPDDFLCIVDDDIIYLPKMLEKLWKAIKRHPGALVTSCQDSEGCPTGYSGYILQKKHFPITPTDLEDLMQNCYYTDDTWVGKVCQKNRIPIVVLNKDWDASINKGLTDTHPKWDELCESPEVRERVRQCLLTRL